jgi:serine/threonine-protein kinase
VSSTQSDPASGDEKERDVFSDPSPESLSPARVYQPGDIIAQKYRLTRLLGQGGMGAVWLARNQKLDVDVAIKLIRYEHATADTSYRLLQEARAAARIGHRSIVRVFDFGETELDDPFIVMEMLTGESMRDLLDRKGRLPATQAARTLLPIASALVEAHASGIVHRDLKPENVMLVPDASGGVVPKLLDFGIAHFRRTEGDKDEGRGRSLVAGTLEYMSPEQMGPNDPVDGGADVWSLAVMLYEAITGAMPFGGPSHAALIFAIMTEEPTSSTEQLAGDEPLWTLIKAALAKQCSTRPTMRAFGRALAEWTIQQGIDSDVAGNSLAAHWLNDTTHPYSVLPPPVSSQDGRALEVTVPRPAALPRGMAAPTEAPPPPTSRPEGRRRGRLAVAVAAMAAAAAISLVGFGRTLRARRPPALEGSSPTDTAAPARLTTTATPASTPGSASAIAAPEGTAAATSSVGAPESAPTAAAPAPSGAATLDPPLSAVGTLTPGSRGRPVPAKRQPRKSTLPIAKQPNF